MGALTGRRPYVLAAVLVALAAAVLLSLMIGRQPLSPAAVWDALVSGAGSPAGDVVRGLREVIDAGAEMLLLNPVGPDVPQNREQMERLAAEVIPQLS